jgi:Ca2+-binding RTX toxin-like protein
MEGGAGDDLYFIDSVRDRIVEAAGGGTDRAVTTVSYRLAEGAELEELTLHGDLDIDAAGNGLAQTIIGSAGANAIGGGGGDDILRGGAGNDTLGGGAGADRLEGGDGVDLASYAEAGAGLEIDMVEALTGLGAEAGEGRGDVFDGIEGVEGSARADTLRGDEGANLLLGDAGDDLLQGRLGADTLDGGSGRDTLEGGAGDDVYVVDRGDRVVERAEDGGFDEMRAASRATIAQNVEQLTAIGTGNIRLNGRETDEALVGNAGDNVLVGFGGADTMFGGDGDDAFVLTAARGTAPAVSILDFLDGDQLAVDDQLLGLGNRSIDVRDLTQDVLRDLIAGGRVGYSRRDGEVKIDIEDDGTLAVVATIENGTRLGLDDVLLF